MAPRPFLRFLLALSLIASLSSCSDRERVLQKVGHDGYWHLERVAHRPFLHWLGKIPLVSSLLGDTGDRWWFVSPKGERTFLRSVSYVGPDDRDRDAVAFAIEVRRNLLSWGFNAAGFYSDEEGWRAMPDRLPALSILDRCSIWNGVFEDWFGSTAQDGARAKAAILGDCRDAVGISWGYDGASSPGRLALAYGSFPGNTPSKQRLVSVIRRRCKGDLKQLWARMPDTKSFDELTSRLNWSAYDGIDDDGTEFAKELYAAYGAAVGKAVKDHLAGYVNLGPVLWPDTPIPVLQALAPYVDVLTFNVASADGRLSRAYLEDASRATGKPVLIWASGPALKEGPGCAVETEAGQAISFRRLAGGTAALPFAVGFSWSSYRDGKENHDGLLDWNGNRRQQVLTTVSETNAQLDLVHLKGAADYYPEYFREDRFASGRPRQEARRLPNAVVVDGDLGDWPQRGWWLENVKLSRDLDPVVFCGARIGWDAEGLCLAVEAQDNAVELLDPRVYWVDADYVEVFLDASGKRPARYDKSTLHLVLLPRGGGADGTRALAMAIHHPGDRLDASQYDFQSVAAASSFFKGRREYENVVSIGKLVRHTRVGLRESSWKLECRIPWSVVGVEPAPEVKLGFNLIVHRMGQREEEAFWAATRETESLNSPRTWGQLVLAAEERR